MHFLHEGVKDLISTCKFKFEPAYYGKYCGWTGRAQLRKMGNVVLL